MGAVAVAARRWRHGVESRLSAIVKATFRIDHDRPLELVAPLPLVVKERYFEGNPLAGVEHASDVSPFVVQPEIVVVGHATTPNEEPRTRLAVRLAVARVTTMLVDKRLEIAGDREERSPGDATEPRPFTRMPLRFDRALGGAGHRDNPIGIGLVRSADGALRWPNVGYEGRATGAGAPASFGAISTLWPARRELRGALGAKDAEYAPEIEFPADFRDEYYQTAPRDQRVATFAAGDMIAISGMRAELPTLRFYLPKAQGVAIAEDAQGHQQPIALRLESVHIDVDALTAELVWRGSIAVEGASPRIAGAVELGGVAVEFPRLDRPLARPGTMVIETAVPLDRTIDLSDEQEAPRGRAGTLVIELESMKMPRHAGTMILEPEPPTAREDVDDDGPSTVVLGDAAGPSTVVPTTEPVAARSPRGTSPLGSQPPPPPLPFAGARQDLETRAASTDATPWAKEPLKPVPRVTAPAVFEDDDDPGTLVVLEAPVAAAPLPAPVASGIDPNDVITAAAPRKRDADLWRKPLEEAPVAPAPVAPKPAAPPNANLKKDLYKKFR